MLKGIAGILTAVITAVLTMYATGILQYIDPWDVIKRMPTFGLPDLDVGCSANPEIVEGHGLISITLIAIVTAESAPIHKASVQIQASEGYFASSAASRATGQTDPHGIMSVVWTGKANYPSRRVDFTVNANKKEYDGGNGDCTLRMNWDLH